MTFIDTSVFIAVLADEGDRAFYEAEVEKAERLLTSPIVRLETALVLASRADMPVEVAERQFQKFLHRAEVAEIPIDAAIGSEAVECARRFGKGRHPARLNFADCLSYACAKLHHARLLFKGDDFAKVGGVDFS